MKVDGLDGVAGPAVVQQKITSRGKVLLYRIRSILGIMIRIRYEPVEPQPL